MKVLKFGGTSVGSFDMITRVVDIIEENKSSDSIIVVVSAMSGVTNKLYTLCDLALEKNTDAIHTGLQEILETHKQVISQIDNANVTNILEELQLYMNELGGLLNAFSLMEERNSQLQAKILYFGEMLSSLIISFYLRARGNDSQQYLSKNLLVCQGDYMDGDYVENMSRQKFDQTFSDINLDNHIPIFTGFGGGDDEENVYLFDRGGSDYVGTLIGSLFGASRVEIWTDVDGVMSADPRVVSSPILWDELSYGVAAEFAISGAKVLHPKTISPAQKDNITLVIKNTFSPHKPGTQIGKFHHEGIRGINVDNDQTILSFIDPSMIGGYGYIADIINIFKHYKVSIDCMATTETSFSISVSKEQISDDLLEQLNQFGKNKFVLDIIENVSKISIVGNKINNYEMLTLLDNIFMISEGAYKKSLTIFTTQQDSKKLLTQLHTKIFNT